MSEALRIITREHRNLVALLSCLRAMLRDAEAKNVLPDIELIGSVFDYLESYLNQFHHPKETAHLFPALRRRRADLGAVLDDLESQHESVETSIEDLRAALARCGRDGLEALPALRDAVERYAEFELAHMGIEEREVMPAARESLSQEDWQSIDAAFCANDDPLFGAEQKTAYRKLFTEIAARAPAPYGLGPAQQ